MSDGLLQHLPTQPDVPHPLGRSVVWHDPRNREHRALEVLRPRGAVQLVPWWARHNFDQRGSSCTFQAAAGAAFTSPYRKNAKIARIRTLYATEDQRHAGYLRCQNYDPWPGGEPEYEGSSTDAPYKLLREEGLIDGWAWYFGAQELGQGVRRNGPASAGTIWYYSMFDVDKNGYLIVNENSGVAGGHAYEVYWWDEIDDEYYVLNSWGRPWGVNGRCRIRGAKMRHLLEADGEAATIRLAA